MKSLLLTPIFKRLKKSAFFSSFNQNNCTRYDAKEKNKNNKKLLKSYTHKKRSLKINDKISIEEVIKCISKSSLKYMINSRISDIFYSMDDENSHKSLTIELIFRGNVSTLSDQEVNEQMTILIKRLKDKLNIDIK